MFPLRPAANILILINVTVYWSEFIDLIYSDYIYGDMKVNTRINISDYLQSEQWILVLFQLFLIFSSLSWHFSACCPATRPSLRWGAESAETAPEGQNRKLLLWTNHRPQTGHTDKLWDLIGCSDCFLFLFRLAPSLPVIVFKCWPLIFSVILVSGSLMGSYLFSFSVIVHCSVFTDKL